MKPWWVAALALATIGLGAGAAGAEERVKLGLAVGSFYTDNLIQYSDGQILVFDAGTHPERYSIESIDDLILRPALTLGWESIGEKGRGREVSLRGSGSFHEANSTADFRSLSFLWRESFGRDRRLSVRGYYAPGYYLRQLRDEDYPPLPGPTSVYRRAQFDLFIGSLSWRQRLARGFRGEATYQYERRNYNPDFEERSSNTSEGDLTLEWYRIPGRGSVRLYGGYRKSSARAEDSDGVAGNDADVSYHGIRLGASGSAYSSSRGSHRFGGDLAYEYAPRDYDSDRPADNSHYGRTDHLHMVEAGLRYDTPWRLSLRAFYHFEDNAASFPPLTGPTTDPSSYTENQVGLTLDWSLVLWKRSPVTGEPGPPESP